MHLPHRPPLPEHGGIPRPPATRTPPTAGGDPVFASHGSVTQWRMISQLMSVGAALAGYSGGSACM
jgi:hypothetical protein